MEISEIIELLNEHSSVVLDVVSSEIDFVGLEAIVEAADITETMITLRNALTLTPEQRRNLAALGGCKVIFDFSG